MLPPVSFLSMMIPLFLCTPSECGSLALAYRASDPFSVKSLLAISHYQLEPP